MIKIIGDIHIPKEENLYSKGLFKALEKIINQDEVLILCGDIIDNIYSVNFRLCKRFKDLISEFKEVYIVTGNHDINNKGNFLHFFSVTNKIHIIEEYEEKYINDIKFSFYPYLDKKMYSKYIPKEIPDYTVGHYSFKDTNFGSEDEIELPYRPKALEIIGHIHNSMIFKDKVCIGSFLPVKYGEHLTDKYVVQINGKNNYKLIKAPLEFTYIDVNFGDDLPEGNYIYCIHKCPEEKLAYSFYKNVDSYRIKVIPKKEVEEDEAFPLSLNISRESILSKDFYNLFLKFLKEKNIDLIGIEDIIKDAFRE